ncbi:MAG TPA: SCP-like extracellular [Leucothrix sp.]|nr:SCP-like extracellular [Leucothrix sp.]
MKNRFFIIYLIYFFVAGSSQLFATESNLFKGITHFHNNVRATHYQTPLSWSDHLANYATQWVNHLATTKNCAMIHRPNKGNSPFKQVYGENLFWASPEVFSDGETLLQDIDIKDVFQAWAEEESFYNYQTNTCQQGKDCGHFTQIVWHETQKVGCAMAICPDMSQIWACNYSPRGNYIGEWPY